MGAELEGVVFAAEAVEVVGEVEAGAVVVV